MLEQQARRFQEENIRNLYDLNLEKSRLRTIINCMANGVMVTNRNMEVVLHNPALMRLLEIPEKQEGPVPVSLIIKDKDLLATLDRIRSNSPADASVSQEVMPEKRPSGPSPPSPWARTKPRWVPLPCSKT